MYRQRDHALHLELATEIDFANDKTLEGLLTKMDTIEIHNDDEQTTLALKQNLAVAKARLIMHMYAMKRLAREDVGAHIDSVLNAKQLDVVIELLRCLVKCKDAEFLERIRLHITAETKKSGKIYYLMLDIFDELSA
jgi:hypothetical protein